MTSGKRRSTRSATAASRRGSDGTGLLTDGGLPTVAQTRQVLVAGNGITGVALAAFLQRSGHDTVLVDSPRDRTESAVTTLWPPALELLDRIGVGAAVRSASQSLDTVAVRAETGASTDCYTLTASRDALVPLVVGTETLRGLLGEQAGSAKTLSTGITSISTRSGVPEVEFENGVREYFDVVVGADGAQSVVRSATDSAPPNWTSLGQFEVSLTDRPATLTQPLDSWQDGAVAQTLPFPDGGVLRVTTSTTDPGRIDATPPLRSVLPDAAVTDDGELATALSAAERASVRQVDAGCGSWATDRVAYCGAAAFPVPRVTGLRSALALEDAWVLADELARGPDDVADAVAAHGRRRRRRIRTLVRQAAADSATNSYPAAQTEPLATTSTLRAAALGSLGTGSLAELQRDVPGRL